MRRIRPHLTYANVMSTIAVFVVLAGGTAWAASQIGTKDIKDGAVTTAKLHDAAVTNKKLGDGSVGTAKIKDGAVGNSDIADAAVGSAKLKDASVGTAKLKDGSVSTSKIQNDAVTGAKVNESSLGTVPKATIGMSPVAYALVRPNGTVDASRSRGVTNANVANDPSRAGTFCIKAMTGVKTAVVSAGGFPQDGFPGVAVIAGFTAPGPVPECAGAQFTVGTVDLRWGATPYPQDLPFYIWFFN